MALSMNVTTDEGLAVAGAYVRVKKACAWKDVGGGYIGVYLEAWRNQAAVGIDGIKPLRVASLDNFTFPADVAANVGNVSLYGVAYAALKRLQAFATAVDA